MKKWLIMIGLLLLVPSASARVVLEGDVNTEMGLYKEIATVIAIAIGVVLRTYYPYKKRKNEGKIDKFDDRYAGTMIGSFFFTLLAWLQLNPPIVSDFSWFMYIILTIAFAYLGNEGFNRAVKRK